MTRKKILTMILALVMLMSMTATVFAAESYGFTIEDNPFEIYDILLKDHSKAVADQYKLILMTSDSGHNPEGDLDQYGLGPTVLYEDSALQIAADYANSLDNTTATNTQTAPVTVTPGEVVTVTVNGVPMQLEAVVVTDANGGATTYFKLRDIGNAVGFQVDWTAETGITVNSK